jgi:hypothetical protein
VRPLAQSDAHDPIASQHSYRGRFSQIGNLHKKLVEMEIDLHKISMSIVSSTGISRELFCLQRVEGQASGVDRLLYPVLFVVQVSSFLTDPGDKIMSVTHAATPLSQLLKSLDGSRDEINHIYGGCRQYPLVYDQAKLLMKLVEETQKTVLPILK